MFSGLSMLMFSNNNLLTFIEGFLGARYCANHFTGIISFHSQNNFMR